MIQPGQNYTQTRIELPRADVLRVPCPTCGAQRREPCHTLSGGKPTAERKRRWTMAGFIPLPGEVR